MSTKFKPHWNEPVLTRVCDAYDAMEVQVSLVKGLDMELARFVECGYLNRPSHAIVSPSIEALVDGGALWQALECLFVDVAVSGVSRIFTHQLVRQRIGITFSQQCSGEVDWRHADVLIPRACKEYAMNMIEHSIADKVLYADMVDSKKVSLQEARYILPQTLATHINFRCSLATLFALYSKRVCTMSNCWEMVLFAGKLASHITAQHPELEKMFRENCLYKMAKPEYGIVFPWQPDGLHEGLPVHESLYDKTHYEMVCAGDPCFPTEYWREAEKISLTEFHELENTYVYNS